MGTSDEVERMRQVLIQKRDALIDLVNRLDYAIVVGAMDDPIEAPSELPPAEAAVDPSAADTGTPATRG